MGVVICGGEVVIRHAGKEVARHTQRHGRRERAVAPAHLHCIVVAEPALTLATPTMPPVTGELLRPLAEYEQAAGGSW